MLTFQQKKTWKYIFLSKPKNLLYLGFKFSSCVLKHVMEDLKSEFCKKIHVK